MPVRDKMVATGVIVFLAIMLCTVGRTRLRWLSESTFWALGESDPFRRMLFVENGDIRRWGVIIIYAIVLALVWFA